MTLRKERAKQLAQFVVNLGMSPADYWGLTVRERNAIMHEFNRVHSKKK